MNNFFLLSLILGTVLLSSCNLNHNNINKIADEMCAAMSIYHQGDPVSMLKAANAITEISKKEDEYGDITEEQFKKAMEKKCPDGYKKFIEIGESGKKAEAR